MTDTRRNNLKICTVKNLPELPVSSINIIAAVNNPDIDIEELVALISISPVLTARLLGLANSAYFGHVNKITDLRTAIIRVLGLNLVKCLALGILLNLALDTRKCPRFISEKLWMRSLVTAILSHKLCLLLRHENLTPSTSYTAGLILNIGLVAAVHLFPEETDQALSQAEQNSSSISEELIRFIGYNQYEIGGLLLEHWHLPSVYQTVVKEFKNGDYVGDEVNFVAFLTICVELAKKILAEEEQEVDDLVLQLETFGGSAKTIKPIISDIRANKDKIYLAALSISGK
ncbi:MAG: HDOD domain-containing protein [Methylococcaceae bacterium]|nr:HDOD domain-containing protein [Methylococcaceae bacterium]